jgi:tetratricopeptide (TPR) repeat protein
MMAEASNSPLPSWSGLVAAGLFFVALALYAATISPEAFPGESAALLVGHAGLDAFPPLTHYLWGLTVQVLAALPFLSLALKANIFSAVCGAACVALLYTVVSRLEHNRTFEETASHFNEARARMVSGIVAAAFLMVSLPFWIASTRAHTNTFDLLLFLVATLLFQRYRLTHRLRDAHIFVLVYVLSMTEFETMIGLAPLFGILLIYELWAGRQLKGRIVLPMLGTAAIGLAPYFLSALRFAQSPAYEWRSFDSYWAVLWQTWREQYQLLTGGVPKVGWLLILFTTLVPWAVLLLRTPGRAIGGKNAWGGSLVLCGVLTALAGAILFNTTVAPWSMTKTSPLLVTPYALAAMWSGYLGGYWYCILTRKLRKEAAVLQTLRKVLRVVYAPALAAVFIAAAVLNLPLADGKDSRLIADYARTVLDNLNGRSWLVSDGLVDDQMVLELSERDQELNIIKGSLDRSKAYRRYVASLVDDSRLKMLAYVGLGPMLNEWIGERAEAAQTLAVMSASDLWYAGPYRPMPNKVLFVGAPVTGKVDTAALLAEHEAFWDGVGGRLARSVPETSLVYPWAERIRTHLSKVSNNLGVFLEDMGDPDAAFDVYQQARLINSNNISALLNQHALAKKSGRPELGALDAEVTAFIKKVQSRFRVWSLAQVYGYVRYPEAYAQRGWAWAMSGKPNLAITDMRRALELSGNSQTLQLALANLYLRSDQSAESEEAYLAVLEKDPDNANALLGMARVSIQKGDFEAARGYFARLEEMKVPEARLAMERSVLEALSGNVSKAAELLKGVVADDPDNQTAWAALASVSAELNDQETLARCLEKLESGGRKLGGAVRISLAQIALSKGDTKTARKHLEDVLRARPGLVPALEMILRLDVYEGQRDVAEQHVETLLQADPKNALGNYIQGSLLVAREQYSLAEAAYRTSLERRRAPETLNDLAWVLLQRGQYDEALAMARESLTMDQNNGSTWDTIGAALMAKGQYQEAREAIQQALSLKPNSAPIMLNMAKLYEKLGMQKDALRLADSLLARPSEIPRDSYEQLRELVKRLRTST